MKEGTLFFYFIIYLTVSTQYEGEAAKILCVSHQFGSHMLMVHTVAEGLISKGHEVYTVFSDKMKIPKGLEERGFKILKYHTPEESTIMATDENADMVFKEILEGSPGNISYESAVGLHECVDMDEDIALEQAITRINFDLLIIDVFPLSSCLTFLALKHEIPFVLVPPAIDLDMMRTPILPSFAPVSLQESSDAMSFTERLKNTLLALMMTVPAISPFTAVKDVNLVTKYSKDPDITSWKDLARKAELYLVTRGHILEYPFPLMPNVINIECLTCKPPKPLDAKIEDMLAQANGIIIVSFGSLIAKFPDFIADKFLKAFGQRKELVIWRYTGTFTTKNPENVKVMKWLPQNDLLAHPKTKLFITHSGNNGQYESVYHGVPMLAFPLFAEQPHNAHRIVIHGYGLKADIRTFTSGELSEKMREVIENPFYRENTQKAAHILKSAPMNARESSVFWIEHILEFGGEHLRSYALKMPWYSYYMLDILLLVELILVAGACILFAVCLCLKRHLVGSPKKEKIQ